MTTSKPQVSAELVYRAEQLDTAAVSDALDSLGLTGHLKALVPRVPGSRTVGPAYTVTYRPVTESASGFHNAANYLDDVPAGSVVVVDNFANTDCTNWGGLLTSVAQRQGVRGTVVHGAARDIAEIRDANYPLFSVGVSMVSGKNRVELDSVGREVTVGTVIVRPGDLVIADDNGVLVIPEDRAPEVITRAEAVERTEAKIAAAVSEGIRLDEARSRFGYAQPWNEDRER
ncbi:RraA family protein [Rhodococcus sp. NPDC055024]